MKTEDRNDTKRPGTRPEKSKRPGGKTPGAGYERRPAAGAASAFGKNGARKGFTGEPGDRSAKARFYDPRKTKPEGAPRPVPEQMQEKSDKARPPRAGFKEAGAKRGAGFEQKRGLRPGVPGGDRPRFAKDGARPQRPVRDKAPADRAPKDRAPKGAAQSSQAVSPARMCALRALYEVYYSGAYANLALDQQLKTALLSDEDRRLCTGMFYLCVEKRKKIEYILAPFVKAAPDDVIVCILHLAAAQMLFMDRIPPHAAVNEAVNQAKAYKKDEAAGFVNGVLRSVLRAKEAGELHLPTREDGIETYLETEYSASPYTVEALISAFGPDEAEQLLAWRPQERFETIRPNLLRWCDEELEAWLQKNEIRFERSQVPHAYRVYRAGSLVQTPEYEKGLFSIQGESAILAALAVSPRRGMNILDACAAPGGKAALMGEEMQGSGRVYCWDLHEHRVELMKKNARRLGLDNLRCVPRDASLLKDDILRTMDAVLVDAPCSGLGVMADKPDIRQHFTKDRLLEICKLQQKLLDACCEYVRPGGRLVYSTCTILPQENEERVHAFLLSHPDFKLEEDADYLPEALRAKCEGGLLKLRQDKDELEGFFIARMVRVR